MTVEKWSLIIKRFGNYDLYFSIKKVKHFSTCFMRSVQHCSKSLLKLVFKVMGLQHKEMM
jgi:hypothetical protein